MSYLKLFKEGKPYMDVRYRHEFVDQADKTQNANASTIRTRVGYKTGSFYDFSAQIEFEDISLLGDDKYNNTLNGKTDHPTVADVEATEVNQLLLKYTGIPDTKLKFGRQVLTLDNHRFIGHVGWRQNNQTFDAFKLVNSFVEETKITYAYIDNVNRIFGDDSPVGDFESNSHLLNISNNQLPFGKVVGYGYFLDFESDSPGNSSSTVGLSFNGKQNVAGDLDVKYHLEYARQSDFGDNTTSYDANYYHIAPALAWKGLTATVGYEVLGSDDGMKGFSTPLATGHKFNGWADKFLATPNNGLEDLYVDVTYNVSGFEGGLEILNGLMLKFQYHDFSADEGGADYGKEVGLFAKKSFTENYYVEAKYADYDADTFATDTQKFVFGVGLKY